MAAEFQVRYIDICPTQNIQINFNDIELNSSTHISQSSYFVETFWRFTSSIKLDLQDDKKCPLFPSVQYIGFTLKIIKIII